MSPTRRAEEMAEDVREFIHSSAEYAEVSKAEEEFRKWRRRRLERFQLSSANGGGYVNNNRIADDDDDEPTTNVV